MDFLFRKFRFLMEKSLTFLWTKQAALLDNIANTETPEYKAKVVTFEESICSQLEQAASKPKGSGKAMRGILEDSNFSVFEAQEQTRMDDNGVTPTASGLRVTQIVEDKENPMKIVYDPTHPDANEDGYLELPNMDMVMKIADAMAASRAFASNITAFNTPKSVISSGLDELRKGGGFGSIFSDLIQNVKDTDTEFTQSHNLLSTGQLDNPMQVASLGTKRPLPWTC